MTEKIQFVVPNRPLWEYIGDLSQDILECSYNDDDIRRMWVDGRIDDEVKQMLTTYPWRMEGWYRDDGLYSDQLTALVIGFNGWSPNWGFPEIKEWTVEEWGEEGPPKNVVIPPTAIEQAIITAFLLKYEIVIRE